MNKCKKNENRVLLLDSGELNLVGRLSLQRHLKVCESCRAFQRSLLAVKAVDASGMDKSPSRSVLAAISICAESYTGRRQAGHISRGLKIAAYASLLAMILTASPVMFRSELVYESDVDAVVSMVVTEVYNGEYYDEAMEPAKNDLHALARDLLIMEGFYEDSSYIDKSLSEF